MRIHRKGMNGTSEFIIPGFVGIMVFVIVPLVDVFISSFQKSGTENFAGLQNYALVMENDAFRLATCECTFADRYLAGSGYRGSWDEK